MQHFKNEWEASLYITEKVYGSAAAFEKRLDRAALATFQRGAPTLPSSHALVDTFLGRDDKLAVEELMNCECRECGARGGVRRTAGFGCLRAVRKAETGRMKGRGEKKREREWCGGVCVCGRFSPHACGAFDGRFFLFLSDPPSLFAPA